MYFIGTSGWVYPHWRGSFYPENLPQKKWLKFYSSHFTTVEINATFYHSMRPETFLNWRKTVGKEFVFSIKASRYITHIKRLKNCRQEVKKFFEGLEGLEGRNHQEVILWQLPPNFQVDYKRLIEFLKILPKNWRNAFEFRDKSWLCQGIYQLLKEKSAALVIQDSPSWPSSEAITADYTYLRFHGGRQLYVSNYSKAQLENWAKKMIEWNKKGIDVYAYFNNDAMGYAVKNAKTLIKILSSF